MSNTETRYFNIADHNIKVVFVDNEKNNMSLLRSYFPFLIPPVSDDELLFTMIVDDNLPIIPKEHRERLRKFDTGNGEVVVDLVDDGGQQFIYKDLKGIECSMFQVNSKYNEVKLALKGTYDMRCFGISNCFMLSYAIAGSFKDTVLIHASLVRQNGYGYAFHATSGTGKSTQVSMWLRYLPGCDLMNDDNPSIRIIDGVPYIYGTPWSGKTPCYRKIRARLGALTRIDRDDHNWIEKLTPIQAFTSVLPSCSSLKWCVPVFRAMGDTVSKIVETTNVYILHCLPNREAAEVCNAAIAIKE